MNFNILLLCGGLKMFFTYAPLIQLMFGPSNAIGGSMAEGLDRQTASNKTKIAAQQKRNENHRRGPNTLNSFTDMEEAVIRLLSLERTVSPDGAVFGLESTQPAECAEEPKTTGLHDELIPEQPAIVEDVSMDAVPENFTGRAQSTPRGLGRIAKRNYRKVLLEKQTEDIASIKRHVSDCARYARKSFIVHEKRYTLEKKRFELEKEKFSFKKEMVIAKHRQRSDQLQYQLQLLQFKKQKLDFEMGRTAHEEDRENIDEEANHDNSDE